MQYVLTFSVLLNKVFPQVGELCDSLNAALATYGVADRLAIRSEAITMTVDSPQPLTQEQQTTVKEASLAALQERLPAFEVRFESMRCESRKSCCQSKSR